MNNGVARVEAGPVAWSNETDPNDIGWIPMDPSEEQAYLAELKQEREAGAPQKTHELAQSALTGNVLLDQETNDQIRYASQLVQTETSWAERLEHHIEHLEHSLHHGPEHEAEKLRSRRKLRLRRADRRVNEWDGHMSPKRIRISEDIHELDQKITENKEKLKNIKSETERWFEKTNPRLTALHKDAAFRTLVADMRGVEEKVKKRQELLDEFNNPATHPVRRAALKTHIAGWGGVSPDQYREELLLALTPEHAKRVEKGWQSQEDKAFTDTQAQVLERIDLVKQYEDPTTPADQKDRAVEIMGTWRGESIGQFRSRILGNDPVRLERFKAWVIKRADEVYQAVESNPGGADKKLQGQLDVKKQIQDNEEIIAAVPADTEDEVAKQRRKRAESSLRSLQATMSGWKKTTQELTDELLAKKQQERDHQKQAATYEA